MPYVNVPNDLSKIKTKIANDVYIDRVLYGRSDYMSVLFKDLLREETTE